MRRRGGESSPGSLQETSVSLQIAQPLFTWVLLMYSFAPFCAYDLLNISAFPQQSECVVMGDVVLEVTAM